MKFGVLVFPGSNCDRDVVTVTRGLLGQPTRLIWHEEADLGDVDAIVIPGGFSYGDYLRCGAIARFAPAVRAVKEFAARGGYVLGICNGFQILTEAGLLAGALVRNRDLHFICDRVPLRVERADTPWTCRYELGEVVVLPVAHGEGCYYADPETLQALEDNRQVVWRYCDREGNVTAAANPNGSARNIAGVCNPAGNVLGMMPHPERAAEALLGNADGRRLFLSAIDCLLAA